MEYSHIENSPGNRVLERRRSFSTISQSDYVTFWDINNKSLSNLDILPKKNPVQRLKSFGYTTAVRVRRQVIVHGLLDTMVALEWNFDNMDYSS